VRVDEPDPRFGNMLLEQFGGANGELAAAMQYSIQGLNCEDPDRKDLLMDIGTEELSHLEIVGSLARMHLAPMKFNRQEAEADPLVAIAGGGGVNLFNSMGNPWTADYLKITGELDVDLRSNIAAEARAKIVYERLIGITDDPGIKEALGFLMTREIAHQKSFEKALYSIEDNFPPGKLPGVEKYASMYVNASQGEGDMTGAWNSGEQWDTVDDLSEVLPADDAGDGTASVNLSAGESAALQAMMLRLKSDPGTDALTGADLGAGPGAGRTSNGDMGGAADIKTAPAKADAAELTK
jgi:manganese catalase